MLGVCSTELEPGGEGGNLGQMNARDVPLLWVSLPMRPNFSCFGMPMGPNFTKMVYQFIYFQHSISCLKLFV